MGITSRKTEQYKTGLDLIRRSRDLLCVKACTTVLATQLCKTPSLSVELCYMSKAIMTEIILARRLIRVNVPSLFNTGRPFRTSGSSPHDCVRELYGRPWISPRHVAQNLIVRTQMSPLF